MVFFLYISPNTGTNSKSLSNIRSFCFYGFNRKVLDRSFAKLQWMISMRGVLEQIHIIHHKISHWLQATYKFAVESHSAYVLILIFWEIKFASVLF